MKFHINILLILTLHIYIENISLFIFFEIYFFFFLKVQLLESPIFVHLRLQLLDRSNLQHEALMKSLYGLLMLLPQTTAYKTLYNRLTAVSSLHSALGPQAQRSNGAKTNPSMKYEQFIQQFSEIQIKHRDARWARQRDTSLLKQDE